MSRHHRKLNRRRWETVRLEVLDRDGWRCRRCGKAGRLEVDHVVPLLRDPGRDPYDPLNLQSLCVQCHRDKTRSETETPNPGRAAWRALVSERMAESADDAHAPGNALTMDSEAF